MLGDTVFLKMDCLALNNPDHSSSTVPGAHAVTDGVAGSSLWAQQEQQAALSPAKPLACSSLLKALHFRSVTFLMLCRIFSVN